ncbi:MAG: Lrp/AsnC family transcriptional regulator [Candidatus Diapherotrites archaeon]|nr:Lrp/AsnC family transcriptional regulator [Candidatus Diapherotrites archaeon]
MDLDIKDRKLLSELEKNARQPLLRLAKKTGLSRDVVGYRIRQLEHKGIIIRYMAVIDFHRFGYQQYKVYLQLQHVTEEKYREMLDYLVLNDRVKWVAECNGRWDLLFAVITSSVLEFDETKNEFFSRFAQFVADKSITTMVVDYPSLRAYLLGTASTADPPLMAPSDQAPLPLEQTDLEILRLLSHNARQSALDIAKQTGLSPRVVGYRIKQLEKQKVILNYRIGIDLEKIGYKFFKAFIYLDNATPQRKKEFTRFCLAHPNITHAVVTVGNWDIEPEFEVPTNEEFYALIRQIRGKYADIIKKIETVLISKEHKFEYL